MTENPIQRAIAAVDDITTMLTDCGELPSDKAALVGAIRTALQSAAQEAQAWEAIGQWCAALCPREVTVTGVEYPANEPWSVTLLLGVAFRCQFRGPTRLAALSKAAEFCRKELAK